MAISVDSICGRVAAAVAQPRALALGVYFDLLRRIIASETLDGADERQLVAVLVELGEPERFDRDMQLIGQARKLARITADTGRVQEEHRAARVAWQKWHNVERPEIQQKIVKREAELSAAGHRAETRLREVLQARQQLEELMGAHADLFGRFEVVDGVVQLKPPPVAPDDDEAANPAESTAGEKAIAKV